MMQKIEIRLTLSRLVTQNVCVMGIFYLYLLHLASRMNHWLFWKKLGAGGKIFSRNKEIKYLQNFKYNLPSDRCTYIYIYISNCDGILIDFRRKRKSFPLFQKYDSSSRKEKFLRFPDIKNDRQLVEKTRVRR